MAAWRRLFESSGSIARSEELSFLPDGRPSDGDDLRENSQPESSQPESSQPESSQPESSQPESSQPESRLDKSRSSVQKLLGRWRNQCAACAGHQADENIKGFFQNLFLQSCVICHQSFCSDHAGPFDFPPGALQAEGRCVCVSCLPQAESIVEEHKGCIRQQREERGTVLRQKALRDGRHATVEESWAQCLECEAGAISSCQVCGTKLCPAHIEQYPPDVSKVRRLWVCRHCRKYSAARAAAGKAVRDAAGLFFRRAVAAESSAAELIPAPLEEAEDCAACGLVFSKLPGSLRHHCRACGRSLCAGCLCGAQGCLVNAARCPHKARLYGKEERICKDCLPVANCRIEARGTCAKVYEAAARYAEHCLRVRAFLADPEAVPLYEANFVDTVQDKLLRAGGFAVEGAKRVAPFVSLPWSVGVRAVDVVWNYGQYGLLGILMREEIMQGIKTLLGFSSALQDIPPKDLLVGLLYLSAEQRKALRDAPEGNARLCRALGRPAPPKLLEALLGMALLGTFAPYQDTAFEVQRFALQQQWRLVAERLESWKHRPAWALFLSHAHRTAALSIRGTDVEQSRGGDLFTDFDALGVGYGDDAAPSLLAHQGALQAAQALETELRPTLRALGQAGYRVILTGHSLGGAVAALLLWLLKHGTQGERLEGVEILGMGYATPAVVDLKTAEELRPHFTSLVNSMDAVPRLCRSALQRLAHELKDIASGSAQDLDQDLQHYLDRLTSVWAPRFRDGLPLQEIPSHRSEEELTDLWGHHEEEESELYIPGSVVWIHRVRGRLDAALVPCTAAPLRRLLLDKRMIEDHSARSIHQALLAVERAAKSDPSDVKWQKFCDAGERCPCCGSRYEWMNTARSGKMRAHAMTNCRVCGLVVCVGCAASRRSLPELSMENARVCDRCVWRGSGAAAFDELKEVFQAASTL